MIKDKIKIMTIFGTRPEAIKMAPVVLELFKHSDKIQPIVAVTAQHREMLDQVLNLFKIKPDFDLNIMSEGQTLFDITSKVIAGLDEVLKKAEPNMVLVHGDTTTTFAIVRRWLGGQPIFKPDKGHLHHRLLKRGYSQKQAVFLMYVISALLGLSAIAFTEVSVQIAFFILAVVMISIFYGAKKLGILRLNN